MFIKTEIIKRIKCIDFKFIQRKYVNKKIRKPPKLSFHYLAN